MKGRPNKRIENRSRQVRSQLLALRAGCGRNMPWLDRASFIAAPPPSSKVSNGTVIQEAPICPALVLFSDRWACGASAHRRSLAASRRSHMSILSGERYEEEAENYFCKLAKNHGARRSPSDSVSIAPPFSF